VTLDVIVIGAGGTVGAAVAGALEAHGHRVVRASRRGPARVDLTEPATIDALLAAHGPVDAVVCCAASGGTAPVAGSTDAAFFSGLDGKLTGQVELVRRALPQLRDGGSITLTSGTIPDTLRDAALGRLINAGIEAFVPAAARELPRGVRLNTVSPGWIRETLISLDMDPAPGTPLDEVAVCYLEAVEGSARGRVFTLD
jgi:NAD(P)-dependent dehydrogenase (short-subunit alcohol dehydrogenase family)